MTSASSTLDSLAPSFVIDTSVVTAICLQEHGFEQYECLLENAAEVLMSAPTQLELGIVSVNRGFKSQAIAVMQAYDIRIVPFDEAMALTAIDAFDRYGKGRHPAGLNFGDCCSYALAKTRRIPLLYKGDDFALTDIPSALSANTSK
jgi:ribonuclease VapC